MARRALVPGTPHLSRHDLEEPLDAGQTVKLHVLALATFVFRWKSSALPAVKAALATGTTTEPSHGAGRAVDVNITTHPEGLPWTATAPPVSRKH